MSNDMRNLMESLARIQLEEGWEPDAIAQAIYDEFNTEGSPLQQVAQDSPEPYRAMIYAYGNATGLYNPETLDGSEIYHAIVDGIEDRFWENVSADDVRRAQMGEAFEEDDRQDAMDRFPDDYASDMEALATDEPDFDEEPIRKSRLIKDLAMDMDMDWTDLDMVDVDPVDLKGFPKIDESFTRKHFQMVADTLQKIEDPEVRRAQAEEYAAQFAAANPRFNRDLFMAAAGVDELEEAGHNFFDIMRTPSSRPDDEEPYIPRDRHAERPHTPGYDKQSSSAKAAADSRAQAFIFDEELNEDEDDDGDVPSRRVSDEELIAKISEKLKLALGYIKKGMQAEDANPEAKFDAITLRRYIKEVQAFIETGGDTLGLRQKATVAFKKADDLADLSYHYDDVLWEMQDIDNLLYLHLTGRPVAIDETMWEDYVVEDDCECEDGDEECECDEVIEEGIELGSIADEVLSEYRNQPKDYEMSDEELAAEIEDETSEFERDHIDKEIEDEELGMRFD